MGEVPTHTRITRTALRDAAEGLGGHELPAKTHQESAPENILGAMRLAEAFRSTTLAQGRTLIGDQAGRGPKGAQFGMQTRKPARKSATAQL